MNLLISKNSGSSWFSLYSSALHTQPSYSTRWSSSHNGFQWTVSTVPQSWPALFIYTPLLAMGCLMQSILNHTLQLLCHHEIALLTMTASAVVAIRSMLIKPLISAGALQQSIAARRLTPTRAVSKSETTFLEAELSRDFKNVSQSHSLNETVFSGE